MNKSLRIWLESLARRPGDELLIGLANEGEEVLYDVRIHLESSLATKPFVLPLISSLAPREWRLEPARFPFSGEPGKKVPISIEVYWYERGRKRGPLVVRDRLEILPEKPPKRENLFTALPLKPESALFVGRERERDELLRSIKEGKRVIWIEGRRGLGKTTFLKHIPSWLGDRCWRYVDCHQLAQKIRKATENHQVVVSLSFQDLLEGAEILSSAGDSGSDGLILDAFEELEELLQRENTLAKYFEEDLADWMRVQGNLLILAGDRLPDPEKGWNKEMLPGSSLAAIISLGPWSREAIRDLAQRAPFRFDQSLLSQSPREDEITQALAFLQDPYWPLVWLSGERLLSDRMVEMLVKHLNCFYWLYLDAKEIAQSPEADLSTLLKRAQGLSPGTASGAERVTEALVLDRFETLGEVEPPLQSDFFQKLKRFVRDGHPLIVVGDKLLETSGLSDFLLLLLEKRHVALTPLGEDRLFTYVGGHPLLAHILLEQLAWKGLEKGYVTYKDLREVCFEALDVHRYNIEHLWAGLTWLERRALIVTYVRHKRRFGRTLGAGLEDALTEEHLAELERLRAIPARREDILEELTRLGSTLPSGLALQRHLLYGRPAERLEFIKRLEEEILERLVGRPKKGKEDKEFGKLVVILDSSLWEKRALLERRMNLLSKQLQEIKRKRKLLEHKGVEKEWEKTRHWLEKSLLPLLPGLHQELSEFYYTLKEIERETGKACKVLEREFDVDIALDELERKGILLKEDTGYRLPGLLIYWFDLYEESARSLRTL